MANQHQGHEGKHRSEAVAKRTGNYSPRHAAKPKGR